MIVDGKKIADEVMGVLSQERSTLPPTLALGVVMGTSDAASASFVKIKERLADRLRVVVVREFLDDTSTTDSALRALERLSHRCAGVILQLPLPAQIDSDALINALEPEKDVDALSSNEKLVRAPVAEAVSEIFARSGVAAEGKKAVIIGAGKLVGAPCVELLRDLGADVSVVTETRGSLEELADADIVICGAGEPGLVKPEMLKEGVVLIDAGTSESSGKLAGDASPKCAEVASVFTPVPGGVGPIAVAMIFKNLFALAKMQK